MVRSARTGAALATSAGVAGVALAVFQIVQSTVTDFHPRVEVEILIALTIFAFGLVVGRLRVLAGRRQARNDRDRELDEDLAVWPLETFAEIDAYYLGVFPIPAARANDSSLGEYVSRGADAEIEQAIKDDPFVLVFGPPRAGKSRTTYEAARRALPNAWVIVPEGAGELKTLLDVDPPLNFGTDTAVLWLDGLDRFSSTLDLDLMEAVGGRAQRLKIVATIRKADYEAMLEAGGQEGEVGRRVLTRARGIHLPDKLTAAEEREAARVMPDRRKGSPLGAGTAEILSGGHAPADPPRGRSTVTLMTPAAAVRPAAGWRRFVPGALEDDADRIAHLLGARSAERDRAEARRQELKDRGVKVGTDVNPRRFRVDVVMVVALLVFAFIGALLVCAIRQGFEESQPPSLEAQLADALRARDVNTWRASKRAVAFQGEGRTSYLINYTPRRAPGVLNEIRVYDQVGARLLLRFRFQPEPADAGTPDAAGWRFFIRTRKADVDRNGDDDVAAAFRLAGDESGPVLPVVLYPGGPGYLLKGLGRPLPGRAASVPRGQPVTLVDESQPGVHVGPAYPVADFAVSTLHDAVKFIAGYYVGDAKPFTPNLVEVQAWRLGGDPEKPFLGVRCTLVGSRPNRVTFRSPSESLSSEILGAWQAVDRVAACARRPVATATSR